ncbi:Putative membrane protein [Corynebacterium camporealensis]|uniref:Putative membrane protein n=1 Tax=Corynebacterium camporealensis TaxID=161896 RepID=A0A0F6TAN1_9CORY|nr:DoxX family protein [Corynebacterium camporealensis]AKE38746.1 putative membrane protein [Corynebacterium camporealensis]AVH88024.1 Putative membrane protein [Corynebacterium camporealensis]
MNRPAVRDAALLFARLIIGIIFVVHGVDKLFFTGMDETIGQFSAWGVPEPQILGWVVALTELIGGMLLVIGLLATFAAALLAIIVGGASYYVHFANGFFAAENGLELTSALVVSLVLIVVFGAGRASLDEVLRNVES